MNAAGIAADTTAVNAAVTALDKASSIEDARALFSEVLESGMTEREGGRQAGRQGEREKEEGRWRYEHT